MRQCVIHTRTVQEDNKLSPPALLEPHVHKALYDLPEINAAMTFLADNERAEMVAIRIDARSYTVTVITEHQTELQKYAFPLRSL